MRIRRSNARSIALVAIMTISALLAGTAAPAHAQATDTTTVTRAANRAHEHSILRLYKAYFLRDPDRGGLTHWTGQYSSTRMSLADISQYFSQSPEFKNRYGSMNNSQFANLIYKNVLARTPDQAGITFWVQRLNGGTSRGSIMIGFSESSEFQRKTGTVAPSTPVSWNSEMTNLVNAERAKHGLRGVALCGRLNTAAQGHSNYQAKNRVMTHTGQNGSDPGTRLTWAGYRWTWAGENVAMGASSYTVADVVKAWMNSPLHRDNILNPNYVHMGLARTADASGTLYWTQKFGAGGSC